MYENLKIEILRILGLLALFVVIGWLSQQWLLTALVLFFAYTGWHIRQVYFLERWMLGFDKEAAEHLSGIWRYASESISRYQKTGRKRKRRISRLLQRFNETLEMLPDAVVVMDDKLRVEWMNPAANTLLGIGRKNQGSKIHSLIDNKDFAAFIDEHKEYQTLEIQSPVNHGIDLEINLTRYEKGQYLLTAHDITELKKVESIRRDFLGNVSHELRTPLTVIAGYMEMLEKEDMDDAVHFGISESYRQTERMQKLVSDLLMLSKIEMRKDAAAIEETVNVCQLVNALRSDALRLSNNKHQIHIHCDRHLGLMGSETELSSAFGNLIFNAVLHTPENTRITVSWQQTASSLEFSVRDNGPGIEAEHLTHLMERFYRVDKARSRERGGTGLGLSIVKHVVERNGGIVKIVSEVGKGTTFICEFPTDKAVALQSIA